MKKKIFKLVVLLMLIFNSSCSARGDFGETLDGRVFDYYKTITIDNEEYQVSLPNTSGEIFEYSYEVGKVNSTSSTWTINYIYNSSYIYNKTYISDEMLINIYEQLAIEQKNIEELLNVKINLYEPDKQYVIEDTLHNEAGDEISYVIFETYLPIRIYSNSLSASTSIGIPVNINLLLKNDNMVENPFNDEMIPWTEFISYDNINIKYGG